MECILKEYLSKVYMSVVQNFKQYLRILHTTKHEYLHNFVESWESLWLEGRKSGTCCKSASHFVWCFKQTKRIKADLKLFVRQTRSASSISRQNTWHAPWGGYWLHLLKCLRHLETMKLCNEDTEWHWMTLCKRPTGDTNSVRNPAPKISSPPFC